MASEGDVEDKKVQQTSAVSFFRSRKARPVLIMIAIIVTVSVIGMFLATRALLGSGEQTQEKTPEQRQQQVRAAGESDVDAQDVTDLRPDMTGGQQLSQEAMEALDTYNRRSAEDEELHPVPTQDDAQYVDIMPDEPEDEANGDSGAGDQQQRREYEYTAPQSRQERQQPSNGQDQRMSEAERERQVQLRERRQEAAAQLMETYSQPTSVASMSYEYPDGEQQTAMRDGDFDRQQREQEQEPVANQLGAGQSCENILARGGDVVYANNDVRLNTDVRGPVRLTFLSGDLANWRGMGTFESNEFGARMRVRVNRLISPDGETTLDGINGHVMDPDSTLFAVRSNVDRHLIYRYGGFGLATILRPFTQLAEQRSVESERTQLGESERSFREPDDRQVAYTLAGEFGELWREAFADNINRPITIELEPDERIGVMFEDTVCMDQANRRG